MYEKILAGHHGGNYLHKKLLEILKIPFKTYRNTEECVSLFYFCFSSRDMALKVVSTGREMDP